MDATSLEAHGATCSRSECLEHLLVAVEERIDLHLKNGAEVTAAALSEHLAYRDQLVLLDDQLVTVRGVAETGALVVQDADGLRHVVAGRIRPA